MNHDALIVEMRNVTRQYRFFTLENVFCSRARQIMGLWA